MSDESAIVQSVAKGNTRTLATKKKRPAASKYWCFTWNNYTKEDLSACLSILKEKCVCGIVGEEIGDSGTPHLQGYIECDRVFRPIEKFGFNKCHWEKRKGEKLDNFRYCSKDGKYVSWGFKFNCAYKGVDIQCVVNTPNEFQKEALECINRVHNDREIHWFVGDGGDGKTKLAKYLIHTKGACMVGGKKEDCYFGLSEDPSIVLWNCAKKDKVNLVALECIKDGLCYSSKYESKCLIFEPPIVLVFANYVSKDDLNGRIIIHDLRRGINDIDFTKEDEEE
jgi:hypothetical protein